MSNKLGYKFYPLSHDEWIVACQTLKPAERDLLYFIRTMDPYGDGVEIIISEIARIMQRDKSTISRALKSLDSKGFIDLELIKVRATVMGRGALRTDNTVAYTQQEDRCVHTTPLHTDNDRCVHTTCDAYTQRSEAETLTESDSQNPKTLKTLKTLSQSENLGQKQNVPSEELIAFVIRRVSQTAKNPRAYAIAVIKGDRDHWEEEFRKATAPRPEPIEAKPFNDRPRPPAIVVTNSRDDILARAAAFVEMGKYPGTAIFARKKLSELAQEHNITPDELRGFMERNNPDSVTVTIAHPLEVPRLADSDPDQEYSERLKVAQWQFFERPEDNRPCPCGQMTILDCTGECGHG